MNAAAIATTLGGRRSGDGWICRCPNLRAHPHGDRHPSLSITDGNSGRPVFHCFSPQCQTADLLAALESRRLTGERQAPERRTTVPVRTNIPVLRDHALRIWNAGVDPRGTPAEKYLGERELALPDDLCGRIVRFHPSCPYLDQRRPCLILPFHRIADADSEEGDEPTPVAIHRILLDARLGEQRKAMLGRSAGCAIRLDPESAISQGLGIAEGFETALAVRNAGIRPIWALGSAGAISTFPIMPGIESLTIYADHDDAGIASSRACARRWFDAGADVRICSPAAVGADWNDDGGDA